MYICIQPAERDTKQLPYPFFINEDGSVQRQDFWKGEPAKLMGFSKSKKQGVVRGSISFGDFMEDPERAIGMFPIFEHKNGDWFTYQDAIESVDKFD